MEKQISFVLLFIILEISLTGKKPPDDIIDMEILNESKVLRFMNLRKINIIKVKKVYKKNIFMNCLKTSELLKEIKFVNDFFKLSSKMSIKSKIENKKYIPPIH